MALDNFKEFSHSYLIGFSIKTCVTDTFYNLSLIKKDCKTEILPLAYLAAVAVGFELRVEDKVRKHLPLYLHLIAQVTYFQIPHPKT